MMKRPLLWFLSFSSGIAFGAPGPRSESSAPLYSLSAAEATRRGELLRELRYEIKLDLEPESDRFSGNAKVFFDMTREALAKDSPLQLDFTEGTVLQFMVNGQRVENFDYNRRRLLIPRSSLRTGTNSVEIDYEHSYSANGFGLNKYTDAVDGEIYVSTHFGLFSANAVFPCFDQPSLKARITLRVEAPRAWQVASGGTASGPVGDGADRGEWTFSPTAPIATSLFFLAGGPFKIWTSKSKKVPLRLWARKSLAASVAADKWLELTRKGIDYFQDYLGMPFPFKKYDQILLPDFPSEASESEGLSAFTERLAIRSRWRNRDEEKWSQVVMHEIAHAWLGVSVSPEWWNDAWFFEGLAAFLANEALVAKTPFKKAWMSFNADDKAWAVDEDRLSTTHALDLGVSDTDQAEALTDGITYGKSVAVLRLLRGELGEKKFRAALKSFLLSHANKSASTDDFFAIVKKSGEGDFSSWRKDWLHTAGINRLAPQLSCAKGKVRTLAVRQEVSPFAKNLRTHRLSIALLKRDAAQRLAVFKRISVNVKGLRTIVAAARGLACPELVVLNDNDEAYVLADLDEAGLKAVSKGLSSIAEASLRLQLWQSLWHAFEDNHVKAAEFAELVLNHLGDEKDSLIVEKVLSFIVGKKTLEPMELSSWPSLFYYLPKNDQAITVLRQSLIKKFEKLFWESCAKSAVGSPLKDLYLEAFFAVSESPEALAQMAKLLADAKVGDLRPDLRWAILLQLSRQNYPDARTLQTLESKRDTSSLAKAMTLAAELGRPDAFVKAEWFQKLDPLGDSKAGAFRFMVKNLFPPQQRDLQESFVDAFYERLEASLKADRLEFSEIYGNYLVPLLCKPLSQERLKNFLHKHQSNKNLSAALRKELTQALVREERCLAIKSL